MEFDFALTSARFTFVDPATSRSLRLWADFGDRDEDVRSYFVDTPVPLIDYDSSEAGCALEPRPGCYFNLLGKKDECDADWFLFVQTFEPTHEYTIRRVCNESYVILSLPKAGWNSMAAIGASALIGAGVEVSRE
ncbi:MAG: hypothetical protein ACOYM9_13550 [Bradymonadia bacterium]